MTFGLTKLLVDAGALSPRRRGPTPMPAEEAKQRRDELQKAAAKRRNALIKAAREQGEPRPVFKTGRPRKRTPEEACAIKRSHWSAYKQRMKQGLEKLAAMRAEQEQSTSSP